MNHVQEDNISSTRHVWLKHYGPEGQFLYCSMIYIQRSGQLKASQLVYKLHLTIKFFEIGSSYLHLIVLNWS